MNQKPLVYRMCVVSRESHLKSELFRLVKVNDQIIFDKKQAIPGRGVYLKKDLKVIELARSKKLRNKAFSTSDINEQVYLDLINELK